MGGGGGGLLLKLSIQIKVHLRFLRKKFILAEIYVQCAKRLYYKYIFKARNIFIAFWDLLVSLLSFG